MKDLSNTTITIKMPTYLKKILVELAKEQGVGMSDYIRGLIQWEYQGTFRSTREEPKGSSWVDSKLA